MPKLISRGLLTLFLMGTAAAIVYFQYTHTTFADQKADKLPDIGGPFSLTDQHGKKHTNAEFRGKYMLVYFGYSYCPDICPMGLQNITAALKQVTSDRDQIVPIFITIDPERDTEKLLKDYSSNFDPNLLFLTGPRAEIDKTMKDYKVYAARSKSETTTEYLMDHSTLIYLMDREGHFIDHFPHTVDPDILEAALNKRLAEDHQKA